MSEEGRRQKSFDPDRLCNSWSKFSIFQSRTQLKKLQVCRLAGLSLCPSIPSSIYCICMRRDYCLGSFGYVLVSAYDNKWMWISMAIPFFDLCSFESLIILFFKMVDSDCSYNLTCLSMRSHMNITPGHIYHYAYVWSQWHIQNWFITTTPIYSWASRECMSGDSIEIENFMP